VARDLGDLPGRELGVDVLGELLALLAELVDLFEMSTALSFCT
jgi:hypothetical protein